MLWRAHKGASFELQDLVILLLQVEPKELQHWQLVVEALFSHGAKDIGIIAQKGNTERALKNADAMAQYLIRNYSKHWLLPAFLPTARLIWSGGGRPGNAGQRGGRHRKALDYVQASEDRCAGA
ncbi:g5317 [Coccomyxa elongata]